MIQILLNKYDARGLAFRIAYSDKDIRETEGYNDAEDELLEMTMSCNRREAIKWMVHEMEEAIKYGLTSQDRNWRYKYLAAYDICDRL